jgi:hypothetical protein
LASSSPFSLSIFTICIIIIIISIVVTHISSSLIIPHSFFINHSSSSSSPPVLLVNRQRISSNVSLVLGAPRTSLLCPALIASPLGGEESAPLGGAIVKA